MTLKLASILGQFTLQVYQNHLPVHLVVSDFERVCTWHEEEKEQQMNRKRLKLHK